ncbi:hypothetical protein BC629DRAFT_1722945 [Irpex lacteus]|nr:hypothetical protein BC629DRAFT_1722945 [Irpex lacteus]
MARNTTRASCISTYSVSAAQPFSEWHLRSFHQRSRHANERDDPRLTFSTEYLVVELTVPGSRVVDPDSQIYDRMGARPNPSPQPHPPFPSDERRSHLGSSSAPRNESPVFGVETSLLPHPSLETPGSLVHLLWAPTKTTPNLGGKNKKQRLYSVDRKVICEFAQQNPSYKQEEIARKFNIERSTVSKILKNKHRWLRVSNDETVYYAKDRHAKFPGSRYALIAARALELARARGYTEKEFKASPVGIWKPWMTKSKPGAGMRRMIACSPEPTPEELALTQQVQPTPAVPRQEPLTIEYTRVDTPPQGPNYRPNVGAEPSHNDAETSIDTLLIFFKNVRPDMLSMEQRHLLHTIKEELFMAGN